MANDAIRRIRQVFSVEGAEAVVAANQRVASSQDAIARTSSSTERASLSLDRQFSSLERRYVSTVRAQQDYERVQRQVNAAVAQNPALTERASAVLDEANRRYQAQIVASKGLVTANDNITKSTGLARHEMINLSRQVQDIGVSLAGGQSPFTVLFQQGSQVGDIFANTTGTMRGFASQIAALITPMRLLALGTVALGVAAYAALSSWKSFALQIDDAAKIAGTTTREMAQLQAAASFKGIGQEDFSAGVKAFSAALYEARSGGGELYKLLRDNNIAAKDFSTTFENVLALVARAKGDVGKQFSLLGQAGLPQTLEFVRLAEDIKKAKEAAVEFGGAANDNMVRKAREFDEAWNQATTNGARYFKNFIANSLAEVKGFIDNPVVKTFISILSATPTEAFEAWKGAASRTIERARGYNPPTAEMFGLSYPEAPIKPEDFGLTYPEAPNKKAIDPRAEENRRRLASEALQMEQQRLQLLGDLATASERLRLVEIGIEQARLQPRNKITDDDVRRIMDYARATEQLNRNQERLSYLGEAATDTERYALAQERLTLALHANKISQEDFNRALAYAHPLIAGVASSLESNMTNGLASIVNGTKSVKDGFQEMTIAIINDLERMIIKLLIVKPLIEAIAGFAGGFLGGPDLSTAGVGETGPALGKFVTNKYGNAFQGGNIIPFARGGIVNRPTIFPMASGMGLMGEAGPEAVMPLRRGSDGKLGIAGGGSRTTVIVENHSSGEVEQRRETGPNGDELVRIIIGKTLEHMARERTIEKTVRSAFGAREQLVRR